MEIGSKKLYFDMLGGENHPQNVIEQFLYPVMPYFTGRRRAAESQKSFCKKQKGPAKFLDRRPKKVRGTFFGLARPAFHTPPHSSHFEI